MNDQTPVDKTTIWVTRRNPTIMSVEHERTDERLLGVFGKMDFAASDAGHSRQRERRVSVCGRMRPRQEVNGYARPRWDRIGVNARAPAKDFKSGAESDKRKKKIRVLFVFSPAPACICVLRGTSNWHGRVPDLPRDKL